MLIVLTGLCSLSGLLENLNIGIIMPYAECDLDMSTIERGMLTSVPFFGLFATLYFWGFMADTYGRQKMLRICAAGGFLFEFLSVFSVNVGSLIVLRFLASAL